MKTISNFEFNKTTSHEMGLSISSVGSAGVTDRNTYSGMEILTDRAGNRPSPFYYGTKLADHLEFPMEIYNKHGQQYESWQVQIIQEWLFGRRSPHLLTIFDPDKMNESYMCWLTDPQVTKLDNRVIGWKFNVVCTSPYSITNLVEERIECLADVTIDKFINYSDVEDYLYPEMNIQLAANTSFARIENEMDNNRVFQISGVRNGENIYVNNDLGYMTALSGDNIFSKFNLNYFRLVKGFNRLRISGRCVITIRTRFMKAVGGF